MNEDVIRWGICSTGSIAGQFARALARVPDARLQAVSSRSQEKADAFAAEYGAVRSYASLEQMLADPDLDVVYIASPHVEHCRQALQVVEAGKHVLVEKPVGLSAAQVEPVFTAAARTGSFVMEALWSRFVPATVKVRELVAEGAIGEVVGVHASFGFPFPDLRDHRLLDPELGGGALLDLGIYSINNAVQLLGPPTSVAAHATMGPTGVDVNTALVLGFPGGAVATATCSLVGLDPGTAVVVGTRGHITLDSPQHCPEHLEVAIGDVVARRIDTERLEVPTGGDGLRYQVHEVHDCLRRGVQQSAIMSWQHTRDLMTVLDRARECIGLEYPTATSVAATT